MSEQLFRAIRHNDLSTVKQLASNPAVLNAEDDEKKTALMIAAIHGNLDAMKVALNAGADVNHEDIAGRNAFLWSCGEGHLNIVEYLLSIDHTLIDTCTHSGNTALHRCAAYGYAPIIRLLLKHKCEIDSHNEEGQTPLIRAARYGHEDSTRLLIQCGADTTLRDKSNKTAYDWAVSKNFTDIINILNTEKPLPSVLSPTANVTKLRALNLLSSNIHTNMNNGTNGMNNKYDSDSLNMNRNDFENGNDNDNSSIVEEEEYPGQNNSHPVRVEGWMAKQGHIIRNWKNRWFTLEGRIMTYFAKEGANTAKGTILMGPGTDVIVEEKYSKPYCFTLITPTKKFILQAANEDEMVEWIEAIQTNLECCPPDEATPASKD